MTNHRFSFLCVAIIVLNVSTRVLSWLPPYPNATEHWESVHALRKRLNLAFHYTPRHIHPEMCRYLTEEECQREDESMRSQQQSRSLAIQGRNLQQNGQGRTNPKTGRIKVRTTHSSYIPNAQAKIHLKHSWYHSLTQFFFCLICFVVRRH